MEEKNIFAATGRRKESVARVSLISGKGNITVNGKQVSDYLKRESLVEHIKEPLLLTDTFGRLDLECKSTGGGLTGQAGAIRLAISRALVVFNPDYRITLRKSGFLTRDPRAVERKKYGRPKARKRFQYSKR
ncbi:MAG: 30S ribosomal protein S9 [candidate division Zixibacteria bacterium]|nr:30S ribosomal protein S9 [candidate division Zixibacteria bacterium]MDD5425895.1 30S ribosomal protein S9 [candidate division Zixibacteria bacterium]